MTSPLQLTSQTKIAIVGNGAIGNLLALQCTKLSQPYCLMTRDGQPLALDTEDLEQRQTTLRPEVLTISSETDADILILPLKAYQIGEALKQIKPHLRSSQLLIFMHNGMGSLEVASHIIPDSSVIMATTSYAAFKKNLTTFSATGAGTTQAGWAQHACPQAEPAIRTLLNRLLPPLSWHQDIRQALWHKVAINGVINPLTALEQMNNGKLLQPQYRATIEQICQETALVMTASGYPVDTQSLVQSTLTVAENTARNFSSMNRDVALGKHTEIDFINGYIVSQAQQLAIPVPVHQSLVARIKDLSLRPTPQ